MAVDYVFMKCTSCASTRFHPAGQKNRWICDYCGAEVERQERADTMFTIKNVVRQALTDTANSNFDSAEDNIAECEKIDPQYIGTVYARLAYHVRRLWRTTAQSSDRNNLKEKIMEDRKNVLSRGDACRAEEGILFEELQAPEAAAILILTFDFLELHAKRDALLETFDPSGVFNMTLNAELTEFALRTENLALFEQVIRNTDNIDKKAALRAVFDRCPDGEKKGGLIALLVRSDPAVTDADAAVWEQYLRQTGDCFATRLAAATAFCEKSVRPSVSCLMECVIRQAPDAEQVRALFALLFRQRLNDQEADTVAGYALQGCTEDVCVCLLEMMQQTGQYLAFSAKQLGGVFAKADCTADGKIRILEACGAFEIDPRTYDGLAAIYLCEQPDAPEARLEILRYLQSKLPALSTNTIERYLTGCTLDGAQKPTIVRQLFSGDVNRSYYIGTIGKYLASGCDPVAVRQEVLFVLTEQGLQVNTADCVRFLCSSALSAEDRVLLYRRVKAGNPGSGEVMDQYLQQVTAEAYSAEIFTELIAGADHIAEASLRRYVLELPGGAEKAGNVTKLIGISYVQPVNISCTSVADGDTVSCDLLHAYLLAPPDDAAVAADVAAALGASAVSGGDRITVSGKTVKLKKYAAARMKRGTLSPAAVAICSRYRIL